MTTLLDLDATTPQNRSSYFAMDTISTGIGGALLAKALPEDWRGPRGTWAVTLASVVPDADVFADFLSNDPLADLTQHRGFTHSLVGVAVMAPLLALLLWRFTRDKNYKRLLGLVTLGLLWHLFTDLSTSWGTMVFYPFNRDRVVWDWIFIIDFFFTGFLLLPQLLAWTYRERDSGERAGALRRGALLWGLLAAFAALVIRLVSPFFGANFQWGLLALVGGVLAAIFLAPALREWGFRQSRAVLCRIGVAVFAAYIGLCVVSHALAVRRVEQFLTSQQQAEARHQVESLAAIPQPLSPFRWSGLILTSGGVYQSWFSVFDENPPEFEFFPSAANDYVARAKEVSEAKTYLWFARFPVARYRAEGGRHIVEWTDRRFNAVRQRNPAFVFRVVFNEQGQVLSAGFPEP